MRLCTLPYVRLISPFHCSSLAAPLFWGKARRLYACSGGSVNEQFSTRENQPIIAWLRSRGRMWLSPVVPFEAHYPCSGGWFDRPDSRGVEPRQNTTQSVDTVEKAGLSPVEPVDNPSRCIVRSEGGCYHRPRLSGVARTKHFLGCKPFISSLRPLVGLFAFVR